MMGLVSLEGEEDKPQLSLRHVRNTSASLEEGSHQKPHLLVP